jgi:hypothetical protein
VVGSGNGSTELSFSTSCSETVSSLLTVGFCLFSSTCITVLQSFPNVLGPMVLTGKIIVGPTNYDLFPNQMSDVFRDRFHDLDKVYTSEGYRMFAFLSIDVKRDLIGCLG